MVVGRGRFTGFSKARTALALACLAVSGVFGCASMPAGVDGDQVSSGATARDAAPALVAAVARARKVPTLAATDDLSAAAGGADAPAMLEPIRVPRLPADAAGLRSRPTRRRRSRRNGLSGVDPRPPAVAGDGWLEAVDERASSGGRSGHAIGFPDEILLTANEEADEAPALEPRGRGGAVDEAAELDDTPTSASEPEESAEEHRSGRLAQRPGDRPRAGRRRSGRTGAARGDEDDDDTNYDRPRAERPGGGGAPTRSSEEEQARERDEDEAEALFKTRLLARALGLEESSPINVFGWVQGSFTGNPSRPADGVNFGVNPNSSANQFAMQQLYVVVERLVDLEERYDVGFRVDSLYGSDYSQLHMNGLFDNAFPPFGYGFEPTQFYGEVHLPWLTEDGIELKAGRFFALAGYEDARAPARPLNSASYMFGYSHPFTHVGVLATVHVSDQLNVYHGIVNGWDRWINRTYRPGFLTALSWDSKDGRTNFTTTLNVGPNQFPRFFAANYQLAPNGVSMPPFLASRRNLTYNQDNAILFTNVLIHEWTKRYTLVIENDEGYETAVPGIGPGGTVGHESWYGLAGWNLYKFTDQITGVYRAEVFRDQNGARTGFVDTFYEMTLGAILKPRPWFWIRPEVRYDWASGPGHPYDAGRSLSQFTLGFDTIFIF